MSEQGFGDTLQFSRYALYLQQQGFDVNLLSQPALVPLLREAVGLVNVVDNLEFRSLGRASDLDATFECFAKHANTGALGALTARVTSRSILNALMVAPKAEANARGNA